MFILSLHDHEYTRLLSEIDIYHIQQVGIEFSCTIGLINILETVYLTSDI